MEKLKIYPQEIEARQRIAQQYSEALSGYYHAPESSVHGQKVWAQYCLRSNKRKKIITTLEQHEVPHAIYYGKPLQNQTAILKLGVKGLDCPLSEKIAKEIFSIPMHPYLRDQDQRKVVELLTTHLDI